MTDTNSIARITAGANSLRWLLLSLIIVVADQITKVLVITNLFEFQRIYLMPLLGTLMNSLMEKL